MFGAYGRAHAPGRYDYVYAAVVNDIGGVFQPLGACNVRKASREWGALTMLVRHARVRVRVCTQPEPETENEQSVFGIMS